MYKKAIAIMSVLAVAFLCPFNIFASTANGGQYSFGNNYTLVQKTGYQDITAYMNLTSFYYSTDTSDTTSSTITKDDTYKVLGELVLFNDNDTDFMFDHRTNQYVRFDIQVANNYPSNIFCRLTDVNWVGGQLNISSINTSGRFKFENFNYTNDGRVRNIIIPANSTIVCYFELTYVVTTYNNDTNYNAPQFLSNSVKLVNDSYDGSFGNYPENYISYIPDIYEQLVDIYTSNQNQLSVLQQILASYNANVPIATDATQDNNSSQTTSDTQHQLEQGYFNNTNSAINNSGLSNYNFDSDQINGIGRISNDFTYLFNGLGSWNKVYIFALTLTLAMAIIRYIKPRRSSS